MTIINSTSRFSNELFVSSSFHQTVGIDHKTDRVARLYMKMMKKNLRRVMRSVSCAPRIKSSTGGHFGSVVIVPIVKGGMDPKIPFQPGLALGSLFNGSLIEKMEKYSNIIDERDQLIRQLEATEQQIKVLHTREESYPDHHPIRKSLEDQQKQLTAFQAELIAQLTSLSSRQSAPPVFTSCHVSLQSPIDFQRSKVVVEPRGFDSLRFNSQYLDFTRASSDSSGNMHHAASRGAVSVRGGLGLFSAAASAAWATAATDRVAEIKSSGHAEGVLMISAFVTTRHVRRFDQLEYHP